MKSKTKRPVAVSAPVFPVPTHEEISFLAHTLWERRGCLENHDAEIWLEAERQLSGAARFGNGTNPTVTEAAGPLGELGEPKESIEQRLEEFGTSAANRSVTSL
jgi:hypothetical protein